MGSVSSSSLSPALADLFQTLSNVDSPVLSSPAAVSALEKASPSDIAQLSMDAIQLEGADALFGESDGSVDSSTAEANNLLEYLDPTVTGSGAPSSALPEGATPTTSSTGSAATQAASYQTAVQSAEAQALLGSGSAGGPVASLFDVIG